MSKILFMKPRQSGSVRGCARSDAGDAEIIFFPGVRYKSLDSGKLQGRGFGRRWTLQRHGAPFSG